MRGQLNAAAASKRHSTVWRRALREQKSASTRCRSAGRSAASCNKTSGRRRVLPSRSSRIRSSAGFRLQVAHNIAFDDWARLAEGAYLLRSNISDWSDQHTLEGLYPTHPGRSGVSYPQGSIERPPHLASTPGSRSSAYPRVFPRFRTVEEPGDVAAARRPRKLAAYGARRARTDPVARCRATHHHPWSDPPALRHSTRRRPSGASRSPRHHSPQAHAPRRIRVAGPRDQRLTNPNLKPKCSGDFLAKSIVLPKADRRFC